MNTLPTLTELLQSLVRCPSVNPGGPNPDPAICGEAGMADLLEDLLRPKADAVERIEVAPGRWNLIARFDGGSRQSRSYALEAHTDTVGIEGMCIDPFAGELRDGRLYGRGACDTKGPMAAMLLALLEAKKTGNRLPATWYFIATCDEELGAIGARHLVESGFRCDGIVVGEPTGLAVLRAHKGAVRYRLHLRGRAAHSAYPAEGVHALHAAGAFMSELEAANAAARLKHADHPLGPPAYSVGTLRGGDQVNRIPGEAQMEIDCRLLPEQSIKSIACDLEAILARVASLRPGLSYELEETQSYLGFTYSQKSPFHPFVEALATGGAGYCDARYTTNAGFYAAAGIPTIVFGPGSISQAHTADEWIDLEEAERAKALLFQRIMNSA